MLTRLPFLRAFSGRHGASPHPRHGHARSATHRATQGATNAAHVGIAIVACTFLAVGVGVQPPVAEASPLAAAVGSVASAERPANIVIPAPEPAKRPLAVADPAVASGPVTGGTVVTVTGTELTQVSAVHVGGVPAAVVDATPGSLSYQVPVSTALSAGTVPVELFDVTGSAVAVAAQVAPEKLPDPIVVPRAMTPDRALLRAALDKPASDAEAAAAAASAPIASTAMLSFEYLPDPRVTAQTDYVLSYWQNYNPEFNAIYGNDCVNFTSQGLLARGWQMDAEWNVTGGAGTAPWISSTAFRDYMAAHPERGTALDDSQRSSVKVGDIAQFDWDNSGDKDHTSTVTRVDKTDNGTVIYVAGHSKDSDFWNVDEALASGGSVSYWSLS